MESVTYAGVTGVLVTVLLGVGGWVVQGIKSEIVEIRNSLRAEIAEIRATQATKGEEAAALRAEVNTMRAQLGRIESKLDRLLEAGR